MKFDGHPEFQQKMVRTTMLIAAMLIGGASVFLVVTAAISAGDQPDSPLMGYLGAGVGLMMVVLMSVIPPLIGKSMIRKIQSGDVLKHASGQDSVGLPADPTPADLLHFVFLLKTIVGYSFVEGAVFLNTIAYFLSPHWWSAAIAGVLIVFMTFMFPTASRAAHWVDDQLQFMDLKK